MAGIPGDASDARRGEKVRTVTAFPFKCDAVESEVTGRMSFLDVVRMLNNNLRVSEDGNYDKLLWFIRIQLYKNAYSIEDFEEMCEALVSLLYFGLVYPKLKQRKNMESIFTCFLDKWFGQHESFDIGQLILDIEDKYQIASFGTTILLYHLDNQTSVNFDVLLNWRSPNHPAPQWLRDISSCSEDTFMNLNRILYKSLSYFDGRVEITLNIEYLTSISSFLDAIKSYRLHRYDESIAILNSIKHVNCGQFLYGWKELLTGLNLEHTKKENCALVKFKETIIQYPECYYALYYSSRIFQKIGVHDAHLECLHLFSKVNPEADHSDNTLQKVVVSIHLPIVENLNCRSTWLLASSYLINEEWVEARDLLNSLLTKWDNRQSDDQKRSFLDPSDEIPEVPQKSYVTMNYLFVLMNLNDYQEVKSSLIDNFDEFGCIEFASLQSEPKMNILSRFIIQLMVAEALYRQGKFELSLAKCGSVLLLLESLCDPRCSWQTLILLTKIYIYKMLALLYLKDPYNMRKNSIHFARLQDHCLHLLREEKEDEKQDAENRIASVSLKKRIRNFGIEI